MPQREERQPLPQPPPPDMGLGVVPTVIPDRFCAVLLLAVLYTEHAAVHSNCHGSDGTFKAPLVYIFYFYLE